jgi:hypothetical protein
METTFDLYQSTFQDTEVNIIIDKLIKIDKLVTGILLSGESECANCPTNRDPWSPKLCKTGRTYSYWYRKNVMIQKKHIIWHKLNKLHLLTDIGDSDHKNIQLDYAQDQLRISRKAWFDTKKEGPALNRKFLNERAEDYAEKMHMDRASALRAILKPED